MITHDCQRPAGGAAEWNPPRLRIAGQTRRICDYGVTDFVTLCVFESIGGRTTRFHRRPSHLTRSIFEQGFIADDRMLGAKGRRASAERGVNQATGRRDKRPRSISRSAPVTVSGSSNRFPATPAI
jgi:hypothetical protein